MLIMWRVLLAMVCSKMEIGKEGKSKGVSFGTPFFVGLEQNMAKTWPKLGERKGWIP